jgi:hypothetical protein
MGAKITSGTSEGYIASQYLKSNLQIGRVRAPLDHSGSPRGALTSSHDAALRGPAASHHTLFKGF